jgi:hypothetical protein
MVHHKGRHKRTLKQTQVRVFHKLQDAGLKVNADTLKFCASETEYLGYILTRDGIKPKVTKVQVILA